MKTINTELSTKFIGDEIALAKKREEIDEERIIAENVKKEIKPVDTGKSE